MKYVFIIQGEGRGHLTQAISLRNLLVNQGHTISAVIVGKSIRREIPTFFYHKMQTQVETIQSPNFILGKRNKKVKIFKTIVHNLYYFKRFVKSIRKIDTIVKDTNPDIIINFYDLVGGLYNLLTKNNIPFFCVGHQYLISHPEFIFPKGHVIDKLLLKINNRITSFKANKLIALSFREMIDMPKKNLFVSPPLLREEVFNLTPTKQGFLHGYILNDGYAYDIKKWHHENKTITAHFFWDKKVNEEVTHIHPNLFFHKINDKKFLDYMSKCSGFASTAGFESICEAMYLGKPILMVPTEGHYEQKCNALDAKLSGAGIISEDFNLTKLLLYIPKHKDIKDKFHNWLKKIDLSLFSTSANTQTNKEKNTNFIFFNYLPTNNNF